MQRPTRLRGNKQIRNLVRETTLSMDDIIYPIFVVEGHHIREEIPSMKDQFHLSIDMLKGEIGQLREQGIKNVIVFGVPDEKIEMKAKETKHNPIVENAVKEIKASYDDIYIITDVCLCQYKSDGHCCLFHEDGRINREETLELLGEIAVSHARAGAHMIAPSDMMDGRIAHIRQALDCAGYEHIPIMAYSAKYASSFYGPFREAAHSAPTFGDRKAYQMDPGNGREAHKEMILDLEEGADILMVKPAMPYLDIIRKAKDSFQVPIAAYQVSGEYAMLRHAVDQGMLNEAAIYESLIALKRGGADIIITYFAKEISKFVKEAL